MTASFGSEQWCVRETSLDLDMLAQTESLFALSNGHIGVRGNLDEGDPNSLPGTYLNSFFETRPLPYAEAGYGYPESGQTVLNVTNGKLIRQDPPKAAPESDKAEPAQAKDGMQTVKVTRTVESDAKGSETGELAKMQTATDKPTAEPAAAQVILEGTRVPEV